MIDIQTYRCRIGCFVHPSHSDKPVCSCESSLLDKPGCMYSLSSVDYNTTMDTYEAVPFIKMSLLITGIGICCFVQQNHIDEPRCIDMSYSMDSNATMDTTGAVSFINMLLLIAGIESNPGPSGIHQGMNDPLFKNWIKSAYGFLLLKSGLESFVSSQIDLRHKHLMQMVSNQHPDARQCFTCTIDNLLPDHGSSGCNHRNRRECLCTKNVHKRRKCPCDFCGHFYHMIVDDHSLRAPRWSCTKPTGWFTDSFEYLKCYLGTHSDTNSIVDLDCTGILSVVIHNEPMHQYVDNLNNFKECRTNRNIIFHSGDYKISDKDCDDYIDVMISVLEDKMCLYQDPNAQRIVVMLKELKMNKVHITEVEITGLVAQSIDAINELGDTVKSEIEDKRNQIKGDIKQWIVKALRSIDKKEKSAISNISSREKYAVSKIETREQSAERSIKSREITAHMNIESREKSAISYIDSREKTAVINIRTQEQSIVSNIESQIHFAVSNIESQEHYAVSNINTQEQSVVRNIKSQEHSVVSNIEESGDNAIRRINECASEDFPNVSIQIEVSDDIRTELKNNYKQNCSTITVSPLFRLHKEELLKLYKIPTFFLSEQKSAKSVKNCEEILFKNGKQCSNVYLVGDAGVGKSTFCQFLCLLWSYSVREIHERTDTYTELRQLCCFKWFTSTGVTLFDEYMKLVKKFDFVFYITLRDTDRTDVIAIITDQLLPTQNAKEWDIKYHNVNEILKKYHCLVILDGLDEWSPDLKGEKEIGVPNRVLSDNCVYLTTTRPYKTLNISLHKDRDHQVRITGITGNSSADYINAIIRYINEINSERKDPVLFRQEVRECGLSYLLSIPIIVSHLIALWFKDKLINMSRALLYSNIVDMLFEIAVKNKNVKIPPTVSTATAFQLPDSLSQLDYLKENTSLLQKVCLLSFRALFSQDSMDANLVFTESQLKSEPYHLDPESMELLCKIGILSKTRIVRRFGKEEHKLSFLHLSYLEYFAALHVSSLDDENDCIDTITSKWTSVDSVLRYENFLLFLAGISFHKVCLCFNRSRSSFSQNLADTRRCYFHSGDPSSFSSLRSLQTVVVSCVNEGKAPLDEKHYLVLEDFVFDRESVSNKRKSETLKSLLLLNRLNIQSLCFESDEYLDASDEVTSLKYLSVEGYNTRFNQLLIQKNQSTLHTVSIYNSLSSLVENVIKLPHLRSILIGRVIMSHDGYHDLVGYLSSNIHMENIKLFSVTCNTHGYEGCSPPALNLVNHPKLHSLFLEDVNVTCNTVNTSSLKSLTLGTLNANMDFKGIFISINSSMVESLYIHDNDHMYGNNTLNTLLSVVPTLSSLTYLKLEIMKFPADSVLRLHCDIKDTKIDLLFVSMSRACFEGFIDSLCNIKSQIKVELYRCTIYPGGGNTRSAMSEEDYMTDCLKQKLPNVKINYSMIKSWFEFETPGCQ